MQNENQHVDVFHEGERTAQQHAGVRERLAELGPRVIRDYMPDQHRDFFSLLPWLLIGSVDTSGQPWASVVTGDPGFVTSPDARQLCIKAQPLPADPLRANLLRGAPVGILGLQSHTRRRNRVNGVVANLNQEHFSVTVQQSFGNCPKYIQPREATIVDERATRHSTEHLTQLDDAAKKLITNTDTFFIATAHPATGGHEAKQFQAAQGIDVSHRGGKPGFIRIEGNTLLVPDYSGNFFFNTIGNLLLEHRAGLLFIDYNNNDLLQVAVTADILWDGEILAEFPGAQRLLLMQVTGLIWHRDALPLKWSGVEMLHQPSPPR